MKAFDLESVQTLTSAEDIKQKEAEDRRNCAYCKKPSAKNRFVGFTIRTILNLSHFLVTVFNHFLDVLGVIINVTAIETVNWNIGQSTN